MEKCDRTCTLSISGKRGIILESEQINSIYGKGRPRMNYELIWLFLTGSFNGWVLETLMAAWKNKRFVNRGLVNCPFCVLYGSVLVVLTVFYGDLPLFWLFCSSAVLSTVAEWVAGHVIE